VLHNDNSHCGNYLFVLDPVHDFLNVIGTDPFDVDLHTDDIYIAGSYPVTLTVSLPDFPEIVPVSKSFTVTLICRILSISMVKDIPPTNAFLIQATPALSIPYQITDHPLC